MPKATDVTPPDKPQSPPRRRVHWRFAALLVVVSIGTLLALQAYASSLDHAYVNLGSLVLAVVAAITGINWICFLSPLPQPVRFGFLGLVVVSLVTLAAMYRIERVSGELIPQFSPRWKVRPDVALQDAEREVTVDVDLATTTENDFPGFLGGDRRCYVANVQLARDWSTPPQLKWRRSIGAGWSAFAVVNNLAVTLEQRGDNELVTCYEVESGKLVWSTAESVRHATLMGGVGPRSTPTIHAGRVYALGATGILRCLDGATGDVLWRLDIPRRYGISPEDETKSIAWGRANSPLIVDDLVVVPAGGPPEGPRHSLVALDQQTGEIIWEGGDQQISYASPSIFELDGVRQVVSVNEDTVSGHDPSDGSVLWLFPWTGNSNADACASQPQPVGTDKFFVSKGYREGCLLVSVTRTGDSWSTEVEWSSRQSLRTKFTNVCMIDGHVYGLSDGIMECCDLTSGKRRWKRGRFGQGQILGVGDVVLVQAESGEVILVDASPDEFRELGRLAALDGQTWNNLCLSGRRLLVRNSEKAACFELPLR